MLLILLTPFLSSREFSTQAGCIEQNSLKAGMHPRSTGKKRFTFNLNNKYICGLANGYNRAISRARTASSECSSLARTHNPLPLHRDLARDFLDPTISSTSSLNANASNQRALRLRNAIYRREGEGGKSVLQVRFFSQVFRPAYFIYFNYYEAYDLDVMFALDCFHIYALQFLRMLSSS